MKYDNVNLKELFAGLSLDNQVSTEKEFSPVDDQGALRKKAAATAEKLMSDLDLLDLAHPGGSTFLEGIEGDAEVEDLKAQRAKMEAVVNRQVKVKKAHLYCKLLKLSHDMSKRGYETLSEQVDFHISKIANDFGLGITPSDSTMSPGSSDFDMQINLSVQAFSALVEAMFAALLYGAEGNDEQKTEVARVKDSVFSMIPGIKESLKSQSGSHTIALLKAIAQKAHPLISRSADNLKIKDLLPAYKEAFSDIAGLAQSLKGQLESKEMSKSKSQDAEGSKNVHHIIDLFEQKLMDLLYPAYNGTVRTWKGLDADLRKHFGLYPSNEKSIPANGKIYSNWAELEKLVLDGLSEYEFIASNIKMGDEAQLASADPSKVTELSKVVKKDPESFKSIDLTVEKPDVSMDIPHANFKGAPKAPTLE